MSSLVHNQLLMQMFLSSVAISCFWFHIISKGLVQNQETSQNQQLLAGRAKEVAKLALVKLDNK